MNTTQTTHQDAMRAIQLTRSTLDNGAQQLPHEITERLRAARMQALAQMRTAPAKPARKPNFFDWLQNTPLLAKGMVVVPVLAAAFLITLNIQNPTNDSSEVALSSFFKPVPTASKAADTLNIDAILNEKIPLQAYLDDDFSRYLERNKTQTQPISSSLNANKP